MTITTAAKARSTKDVLAFYPGVQEAVILGRCIGFKVDKDMAIVTVLPYTITGTTESKIVKPKEVYSMTYTFRVSPPITIRLPVENVEERPDAVILYKHPTENELTFTPQELDHILDYPKYSKLKESVLLLEDMVSRFNQTHQGLNDKINYLKKRQKEMNAEVAYRGYMQAEYEAWVRTIEKEMIDLRQRNESLSALTEALLESTTGDRTVVKKMVAVIDQEAEVLGALGKRIMEYRRQIEELPDMRRLDEFMKKQDKQFEDMEAMRDELEEKIHVSIDKLRGKDTTKRGTTEEEPEEEAEVGEDEEDLRAELQSSRKRPASKKPRVLQSDLNRFRYLLDMLSYEIYWLNYAKIKEVSEHLGAALLITTSRPISEEDAYSIDQAVRPLINSLKFPLEGEVSESVYGHWNDESRRIHLTAVARGMARALDSFEAMKMPEGALSLEDIQRHFDILAMRMDDTLERALQCDILMPYMVSTYQRLDNTIDATTTPEVKKALFVLYNRIINSLRKLKNEQNPLSRVAQLNAARDNFSKLTTIDLLEEFSPEFKEDIVKGFLQQSGDMAKATGLTSEGRENKVDRQLKILEHMLDGRQKALAEIQAHFKSEFNELTVEKDLREMVQNKRGPFQKALEKVAQGVYRVSKKGKEVYELNKKSATVGTGVITYKKGED